MKKGIFVFLFSRDSDEPRQANLSHEMTGQFGMDENAGDSHKN